MFDSARKGINSLQLSLTKVRSLWENAMQSINVITMDYHGMLPRPGP